MLVVALTGGEAVISTSLAVHARKLNSQRALPYELSLRCGDSKLCGGGGGGGRGGIYRYRFRRRGCETHRVRCPHAKAKFAARLWGRYWRSPLGGKTAISTAFAALA